MRVRGEGREEGGEPVVRRKGVRRMSTACEEGRARRGAADERVGAGLAEAVDGRLAQVAADRAVEPLVAVAPLAQVVGE